jgi:transposase
MIDKFEPITDLQWQLIEPLFEKIILRKGGKTHAPWRAVVNSILLILYSRVKWTAIPNDPSFASKSVAHRWYKKWKDSGFLYEILSQLESHSPVFSKIAMPPERIRVQQFPRLLCLA